MKTILAVLLATFCAAAQAQLMANKPLRGNVPICKFQADMEEMARADSAGGVPAALEVLKTKKDCGIGYVEGVLKGIKLALPTARGATVRVLAVEVTMADGSTQEYYILSDVEVEGFTAT